VLSFNRLRNRLRKRLNDQSDIQENHMPRPRIKDVANHSGVSTATVSHVINNTRFVEEATKARVNQAIKELGYRPSAVARGLATQQTHTIGILISEQSNIFFGEIIRGIEEVFLPENYGLMVCSTAEILEREAHYLDLLLSQRVDGIIAAATSQHWRAISEAEKLHTPIVFVDRAFEELEGCFVGTKNKEGAYLGVKHLIANGHQKIGILSGFDRLSTMRERFNGYTLALEEAGIQVNQDWVSPSALSVEGGREALRKLMSLPDRPTAIFSNNNLVTLGALLEIKEMCLRCPEDVAFVGFDDHPWAAVSEPPLTVVKQPAQQIGEIAARMLLSLIKEEPIEECQVLLDCELVVRESSVARNDCA
jgi:LacI family transcriptional regulator